MAWFSPLENQSLCEVAFPVIERLFRQIEMSEWLCYEK